MSNIVGINVVEATVEVVLGADVLKVVTVVFRDSDIIVKDVSWKRGHRSEIISRRICRSIRISCKCDVSRSLDLDKWSNVAVHWVVVVVIPGESVSRSSGF